tara:strand:+ start:569 stop:1108 length:540 start_codon:yes stop_codon:yes gene_type:complete
MSDIKLTETQEALQTFLDDVIKKSKANLNNKGINASNNLSNSFDSSLKVSKNSFEATILSEDYAKFIDRGVEGVKSGKSLSGYKYKSKGGKTGLKGMPPPKAFDKWNIKRGRAGRDEKGRFLTRKQLNFRTAVGVFNYGIKPTKFFTDPFEEEFKNLPNDLIEAYGLDVEEFIKFILKE